MTETASVKLGGICWDENDKDWVMCYMLEQNSIIVDGHKGYLKACETPTGQPSVDQDMALDIISQSSQAIASLHLTDCGLNSMSGFFIKGNYFLTCSHFEPLNDTLKRIYKPDSQLARASVSRHPQYLALFRMNASQDSRIIRPTAMIDFDSLVAAKNEDFLSTYKNRRVFTIGYNQQTSNNDVKYQEMFQNISRALQEQLSETNASEYRRRQRSITAAPSFDNIFFPNKKTLTVGRLTNEVNLMDGNTEWRHRITGWYGISGAPIACLENKNGPKIVIIDLFTCGSIDSPDNGMRPFSQEDLGLIKEKMEES